MALFYQPDLTIPYLTPEESHHAIRVLRLRTGDSIELTDGKGALASAILTSTDERKAGFSLKSTQQIPGRSYRVHLAIAPTKNIDRMEWLVEKVIEIGVERITFVRCKTSERPSVPLDRLQKLAISAMKQSKQAWLPEVVDMMPFKDFLLSVKEDHRYIAYVDDSNPDHLFSVANPGGSYVVLIGPEGDFTSEELAMALANGFRKVSLGPNRLRTETAGVYGVTALNLANISR
ncbi:MAG: 16S rRNA (uracil(1498)-N(3))-methyltransferase [Cyclobacteriaceae bacterium]|nr:16S rRNA (uracil(1498)-N(3))-methyltransferase [Cyclobacteriaceae bacterium]